MKQIPKTEFGNLSFVRQGRVIDKFDTCDALLKVSTDLSKKFSAFNR
jgi:hypothetical protein